ncbi:hypothetical protein ACJRO7_020144 [Eucalyptus globulus]|uniref:C2H2-type domain-containing protein n=1 Tax=Eucalyptus globulus TaxID=34317 RepID=A0ABD3KFT0_EUCGL
MAGAEDRGSNVNRVEVLSSAGGSSTAWVVENALSGRYSCRLCNGKFASKRSVYGHLRIHTTEKEAAAGLLELRERNPSSPAMLSMSEKDKAVVAVLLKMKTEGS